jgi:hypothetical protein
VVAFALLTASRVQANLIIDQFTSGQITVRQEPGDSNPIISATAVPDVIGGAREIVIDAHSVTQYSSAATANVIQQKFRFQTDTAPPPNLTSFELLYDGHPDNAFSPTGLGSMDATEGGANSGIAFWSNNSSNNGVDLVLHVFTTSAGLDSSATLHIPQGPETAFFLPFSSFSGTPDFTKVGAITLESTFSLGQGGSGQVRDMEFAAAVPEPSTFALLGIGAISLLGYTWRRRKQAA